MQILSSIILSLLLLGLWSCSDSGEPNINGCMDSTACNSNLDATYDDGSCTYPDDNSSCSSLIDYLTEIQPIFISRCADCHINGNSGDLNLSSWGNLMAGDSEDGPVVTVGDSTNSLLWIKVNSGSMPLSGSNLTDAQIHLIAQWIFEGALEKPPNN